MKHTPPQLILAGAGKTTTITAVLIYLYSLILVVDIIRDLISYFMTFLSQITGIS
ncbi:MAG: hypothetical protein J5U19_02920 [Candidatus Methanoperedens sp.]|nr:hypothetical protein [Candidatus Methanoperedens sp.]